MHQPGTDIHARIAKQVAEQLVCMSKGILLIIDVILALGQRGISFKGNWDKDAKSEDGTLHSL